MIGYKYCRDKLFNSQSIRQRVAELRALLASKQPLPIDPTADIYGYPSFLQECNAKELGQYLKMNQIPENVAILHKLAHIEFNAFAGYTDTLLRFHLPIPGKAEEFQADIARVALEEGGHFEMLEKRLAELGHPYGSIPVITGLTKSLAQTNQSLMERIVVISLVQQGKGLDSIDRLMDRMQKSGDHSSNAILKVIAEEEIGHVNTGLKWFLKLCEATQLDPKIKYRQICAKQCPGLEIRPFPKGAARRNRAGFPLEWHA